MTESSWGLLGPESLVGERRTRTLGLGASVRAFNDLAVPGLGGVWFGKQLFLALLGIQVAQRARELGKQVTNIECANAIEAIACRLSFDYNKWVSDARLQGRTKLQGKSDMHFKVVRQRNFYVTQPMRMATVQALPALGLVVTDGTRFNAYQCSPIGQDFLREACSGFSPFKRGVVDHLVLWVCGNDDKGVISNALRQALSPLDPLPVRAREVLQEQLRRGRDLESADDEPRRRSALAWVESLRPLKNADLSWNARPPEILSDHWNDLRAGALFFSAREAAIRALDLLEAHIGNQSSGQRFALTSAIPDSVTPQLQLLKDTASAFLNSAHTDQDANVFCRECLAESSADVVRRLVERDGRVMRLVANEVRPGPAFQGGIRVDSAEETESIEAAPVPSDDINWPEGISYRVRNLFLLNLDLHDELGAKLRLARNGRGDQQ